MAKRLSDLSIENAHIFFKNFSGEPDTYTRRGDRSFCVLIDPDVSGDLIKDGWNIKSRESKREDEGIYHYLKVKVRYDGGFPPKIWMCTKKNKTLLDESTISELDRADIANVDVIISPYEYEVNGKSGVAAYVKTMYVTIVEDEFADKYSYQ